MQTLTQFWASLLNSSGAREKPMINYPFFWHPPAAVSTGAGEKSRHAWASGECQTPEGQAPGPRTFAPATELRLLRQPPVRWPATRQFSTLVKGHNTQHPDLDITLYPRKPPCNLTDMRHALTVTYKGTYSHRNIFTSMVWSIDSKTELLLLSLLWFIAGLSPCQPHRVTSGLFIRSNLIHVEYNTKPAHFTNEKTYNHNPKVSPYGIALVTNGKFS